MFHRIRNTMDILPEGKEKFSGEVELDETYVGGQERNKHNSKKLRAGRGSVGKVEVVGDTSRETFDGFINEHVCRLSGLYH